MKARKLIEGASYEPAQLELIGRAFEEAWGAVAARYGRTPQIVDDARLRLAEAILQHAPTFWDDVEGLKKVALRELETSVRP